MWKPSPNFRCQKSGMEKIYSLGPQLWHDLWTLQLSGIFSLMHVNWCTFYYAGGKPAVIMLKIVGATIHNFVAGVTWHLGFMFLWLIGSTVTMALCICYVWMEKAASRYWGCLRMYWMIGCRQLTGLPIILGRDAANIFNISRRASDLDIFIGKACYSVLGRCIHLWMGLLTGGSDCLGFHVQCVDGSAYSVQNTIVIYITQLIFRICSTCSIYSTQWLLPYLWVFLWI
jgi:hypothetical protein